MSLTSYLGSCLCTSRDNLWAFRRRAVLHNIARTEMSTAVAKEDEDAVTRVTSYQRKEVGFPFIRFDAPKFSFIRKALRTPFASPPKADLGKMKNLPVEVLWQIFRPLNIASLLH